MKPHPRLLIDLRLITDTAEQNNMKTCIVVALIALLCACSTQRSSSRAQSSNATSSTESHLKTQDETVISRMKEYLALDAKGARLNTNEFNEYNMLQYGIWMEESAWDTSVIIENYNIKSVQYKAEQKAYMVTVQYEILGKMFNWCGSERGVITEPMFQEILDSEKTEEDFNGEVMFTWKQGTDGIWRIQTPSLYPHVYREEKIKRLAATLAEYKDKLSPTEILCIETTISKLKSFEK